MNGLCMYLYIPRRTVTFIPQLFSCFILT